MLKEKYFILFAKKKKITYQWMCHYNHIPGRIATQSVKVSRFHSFTKSIILVMEKQG